MIPSQSFNRYSYVLNNPLSLVDPTGYYCGPSGGTAYNMLMGQMAAVAGAPGVGEADYMNLAMLGTLGAWSPAGTRAGDPIDNAVRQHEAWVNSSFTVWGNRSNGRNGIQMASAVSGVDPRDYYDYMDATFGEGWDEITGSPELAHAGLDFSHVGRPYFHSEVETLAILEEARSQKLLEAITNHGGMGKYDFAYHEDTASDTFAIDGKTYDSSEFGNYLAGYTGAQFGLLRYLGVRAMGLFYDIDQKKLSTYFDLCSVPDINAGAERGFAGR